MTTLAIIFLIGLTLVVLSLAISRWADVPLADAFFWVLVLGVILMAVSGTVMSVHQVVDISISIEVHG